MQPSFPEKPRYEMEDFIVIIVLIKPGIDKGKTIFAIT